MRVEYVFYANRIRISLAEYVFHAYRIRILLAEYVFHAQKTHCVRIENALLLLRAQKTHCSFYTHKKRITTLVRIVNALNAHLTCIERTNVH